MPSKNSNNAAVPLGDPADDLRALIAHVEAEGTTRYQIAKAAGMSRGQFNRIASGDQTPRIDSAQRIAEALGYRIAFVKAKAKRGKKPGQSKG